MTIKNHIALSNVALLSFVITMPEYANVIRIEYIGNQVWLYVLLYIAFIFGVVAVDIDEPSSYVGRKLFFLSMPFKMLNLMIKGLIRLFGIKNESIHRLFEHRGMTHMLLFPATIAYVGYLFLFNVDMYAFLTLIAFSLGVFMHQIGDLIADSGIKNYLFPLPPYGGSVKLFPITFTTGSIAEKYLLNIILFAELIYLATRGVI